MGLLLWICVFSFFGGMLSYINEAASQGLGQ